MKKELWVIWKNPNTRQRYKIGILTKHDNNYSFRYDLEEKIKDFDYFPGFPDINKTYNSLDLFTNILNRLPNPNRPDYEKILNNYELNKESSDMEILEKTRGRLITDTYEFVVPFSRDKIMFEVAGVQYSEEFKKCKNVMRIGNKISLELETDNKYDGNAIIVKYDNYKIGYVPRYYTYELAKLLRDKIKYNAYITHLNIESEIKDERVSVKVDLYF